MPLSMSFDLKLFNRSYFHLFCSAWEIPFGMLRHRGSLSNSHKDIYSFTAPCANPRFFLHYWSLSPTAHIRLCVQAEVHCERGVSWDIRQIKVHPGVGWRFYPGRNQFLDNKGLAAPDSWYRTGYDMYPFFFNPPKFIILTVQSDVFVLISPLQPRVYDQKVCILAPCTVHEKDCSNIRTILITNCFLLPTTVKFFFFMTERTGFHRYSTNPFQ